MQKLLIFGGNGLVGSRFLEIYGKDFEINSPIAADVDITSTDQIREKIEQFNPDAVINFAAYTDVEGAENQEDDKDGVCFKVNVEGAKNLVLNCGRFNKYLIHISTDYVFDGRKIEPYTEEDTPSPINWYGMTKYLGEMEVIKSKCPSLIARISMPYRANYDLKKDIARNFIEKLKNGDKIKAVCDQMITPTFVDDIANALFTMINEKVEGILHVVCTTPTTPFDFALSLAKAFGLDKSLISPIDFSEYNILKKAKILKNSALDSSKFELLFPKILHSLDESISLFKTQISQDSS